jgi:hypothetical protein
METANGFLETKRGSFPDTVIDKLIRERELISESMEQRMVERFHYRLGTETGALLRHNLKERRLFRSKSRKTPLLNDKAFRDNQIIIEKEMLNAFYVERYVIHQFLAANKITSEEANEMRVIINGLESYILTGIRDDISRGINDLLGATNRDQFENSD